MKKPGLAVPGAVAGELCSRIPWGHGGGRMSRKKRPEKTLCPSPGWEHLEDLVDWVSVGRGGSHQQHSGLCLPLHLIASLK